MKIKKLVYGVLGVAALFALQHSSEGEALIMDRVLAWANQTPFYAQARVRYSVKGIEGEGLLLFQLNPLDGCRNTLKDFIAEVTRCEDCELTSISCSISPTPYQKQLLDGDDGERGYMLVQHSSDDMSRAVLQYWGLDHQQWFQVCQSMRGNLSDTDLQARCI
ncbi:MULTISPECIES: hypothetical protein [Corallincola]|uniref:Uncharacterized protein n=2 Tax=Corallincola TaxID=1775176 RepID=A0ABY1WQ02_9GAMM|nr:MULTISPECIES: hypothetical protein [Corallincola]TAA46776.1 hypothetical protein EXY25_05845 [Corallincola spongiicola]TCI04421.1 hypothetical protein EZV61_00130 [Corallincola luteus]